MTPRLGNTWLFFLGYFLLMVSQQPIARAGEVRTVKGLADSDTIVLENGELVRLLGIDAPKIKHTTKEGAERGKEAEAFVRKLVEGKQVRLEFDPSNSNSTHKDSRKRTLAYVFFVNGVFLNAELVKQGYAFTIPGFRHKYSEEFRRLEREAKENKRGLWKNQ